MIISENKKNNNRERVEYEDVSIFVFVKPVVILTMI